MAAPDRPGPPGPRGPRARRGGRLRAAALAMLLAGAVAAARAAQTGLDNDAPLYDWNYPDLGRHPHARSSPG